MPAAQLVLSYIMHLDEGHLR